MTRVKEFGFAFPGERIPLDTLPLTGAELQRLPKLGQRFTYISGSTDTDLCIEAGRAALTGHAPGVGLVISAPSLLSAHGLDIPAARLRAALGLQSAECLNIEQGCIGALKAVQIADLYFRSGQSTGDVLIVTDCIGSLVTENQTHGTFFWGDGAAAVLLTRDPGPGAHFLRYAEASADEEVGAMRVPIGETPLRVQMQFESSEGKARYILGERVRLRAVLDALLRAEGIGLEQVNSLLVPSTGANRLFSLFGEDTDVRSRVRTDFRRPHIGAVDVIYGLSRHLAEGAAPGDYVATLSPAFTAQWGGILWQCRA